MEKSENNFLFNFFVILNIIFIFEVVDANSMARYYHFVNNNFSIMFNILRFSSYFGLFTSLIGIVKLYPKGDKTNKHN